MLTQRIGIAIEISSVSLLTGYIMYHFVLFHKHSKELLQNVNDRLTAKNKLISAKSEENETLIKEVHHRVKNNLQIITSLLRLQKSELSPEVESKFDEAIGRIMTMSLIHQKLYQEANLSKVIVKEYVLDLVAEIKSVYQTASNVSIEVNSTIESIGLKTIVPFGLLVNELISNSFKHAFTTESQGKIRIDIDPLHHNMISFKYFDNGTWKEPDSSCSKFGTELIETLTEQLDGTCKRTDSTYEFELTDIDT